MEYNSILSMSSRINLDSEARSRATGCFLEISFSELKALQILEQVLVVHEALGPSIELGANAARFFALKEALVRR